MRRWICVCALLLVPDGVLAEKLQKSVQGSGSAGTANATTRIIGTVGQPVVGGTGRAAHRICHGYWCVGAVPVVSVPGIDPAGGPPPGIDLPTELAFSAPRPNPSIGAVTFDLALPTDATVRLVMYDVAGRAVASAPVSAMGAGRHALRWDARAQGMGAGIYFARLDVDGRTRFTRRVVVVQ